MMLHKTMMVSLIESIWISTSGHRQSLGDMSVVVHVHICHLLFKLKVFSCCCHWHAVSLRIESKCGCDGVHGCSESTSLLREKVPETANENFQDLKKREETEANVHAENTAQRGKELCGSVCFLLAHLLTRHRLKVHRHLGQILKVDVGLASVKSHLVLPSGPLGHGDRLIVVDDLTARRTFTRAHLLLSLEHHLLNTLSSTSPPRVTNLERRVELELRKHCRLALATCVNRSLEANFQASLLRVGGVLGQTADQSGRPVVNAVLGIRFWQSGDVDHLQANVRRLLRCHKDGLRSRVA